MRYWTVIIAGCALLSSGLPATETIRSEEAARRIAAIMDGYERQRSFSGAVAVSLSGQEIFSGAYGLANREWKIANTVETRFSIASVTKPFTAALVLRLVDAGRLALDDTVTEHLPGYRKDTGDRITVLDLLTHSSGLPNLIGTKEFWEGNACRLDYTREEFVERYCSGDLLFEPGTSSRYSDANYTLLALIVESATGKTFEAAMNEWLLQPVGAKDSGLIDIREVIDRLASGYVRRGDRYTIAPRINYGHVQFGAGDMYSTVRDMLRFVSGTLSKELFSANARRLMYEGQRPGSFENSENSCGWNIGTLELRDSGRVVGTAHAPGNNAGFSAVIYRVPHERLSIALVQNAGTPYLDMQVYEICEEIVQAVFSPDVKSPDE